MDFLKNAKLIEISQEWRWSGSNLYLSWWRRGAQTWSTYGRLGGTEVEKLKVILANHFQVKDIGIQVDNLSIIYERREE